MKLTVSFVLSFAIAALLTRFGNGLYIPLANGVAYNQSSALEPRNTEEREVVFGADVRVCPDPSPQNPRRKAILAVHPWLEFRSTSRDSALRVELDSETSSTRRSNKIYLIQASEVHGRSSQLPTADRLVGRSVERHTYMLKVKVTLTNDELMNSINGRGILYDIWWKDPEYRVGPPAVSDLPHNNGDSEFIWNVLHHPRVLGPVYDLQREELKVYKHLSAGMKISQRSVPRVIDPNIDLAFGILQVKARSTAGRLAYEETIIIRQEWNFNHGDLQRTMEGVSIAQHVREPAAGARPEDVPLLVPIQNVPPHMTFPPSSPQSSPQPFPQPWTQPFTPPFPESYPQSFPLISPIRLPPTTSVPMNNPNISPSIPDFYFDFTGLGPTVPDGRPDLPPLQLDLLPWDDISSGDAANSAIEPAVPFTDAMEAQHYEAMDMEFGADHSFWRDTSGLWGNPPADLQDPPRNPNQKRKRPEDWI